MDNFLAAIAQGWARLIEAIGLADVAHSWFVVFFTLVIAAFAVAGAFGEMWPVGDVRSNSMRSGT